MRTVRKGTRSCWACRKRKVRCTFADPSDTACTGCRRRSVRCVGQEFPNDTSASEDGDPKAVVDRLGRVEAMMERLAKRLDDRDGTLASLLSRPPTSGQSFTSSRLHGDFSMTTESVQSSPSSPLLGDDANILQELRNAWPSQWDLDILLSIRVPVSNLFHGVVFTSYSALLRKPLPCVTELLQLPDGYMHPIVAARSLLLLSTYLQSLDASQPALARLSVGHEHTMHRAFETATRLVTSNDRLAESIEGVECILMESMYYNNNGNLRRAWLVLRRAIGIAQLMGLDKPSAHQYGKPYPLARMVDPGTTRARVDPGRMWLRLMASDRYLSLMLGLAPAVFDDAGLLRSGTLEECTAIEHVERLLVVAGGKILRRNTGDKTSSYSDQGGFLRETDQLLRQAIGLMPPQWWLSPSPEDAASGLDVSDVDYDDEGREFRTTTRLMNHMAYYHLLIRLHLPYLLCATPSCNDYEYSRTTAVDASRELLARYVSFRLSPALRQHSSTSSSQPGTAPTTPPYCRGIDFLAFVASTVLCLANIDSRQSRRPGALGEDQSCRLPSPPPHRRTADRGLMEHTLSIMQRMAEHNDDPIATRIASVLQPLLVIEADDAAEVGGTAPSGGRMAYYSLDTESDLLECGGCVGNEGNVHVRIPHLGTIDIGINETEIGRCYRSNQGEEDGLSRCLNADGTDGHQQMGCNHEVAKPSFRNGDQQGLPSQFIDNDWALQGVDLALFEGFLDGME